MKLRCCLIQRYLSDYLDCMLSDRQTVLVAQHLRSCQVCQLELESLRRTKALLRFYVSPSPPAGYYNQFGQQLQQTIEERSRSVWWRTMVDWVRLSPVYAWMLLAVLASLVAYQFLQSQEQNRFDAVNSQHVLKVHPISPMQGGGNRELISNRDRPAGISQSFLEEFGTQQSNRQLDVTEPSAEFLAWESYLPGLVSDHDVLKAMAIRDASPDPMMVAQLSSPDPIVATEDFSRPLGVVITPFPAKIGWAGNRSLNGFVDMLMNVPLPSLSITEVYDSVKL